MHSFDPQLKQQNAEWHAQMSPRKKVAQPSLGAQKVMHVMFFRRKGFVLDNPIPVGTIFSGQYYCILLQDKTRLALRHKQLELLEHDVILLHDNASPLRHCDVQNLVHCWGWEVWHILLSRSHPMSLLDVYTCEKTSSGKTFGSEDDTNIAVTATFLLSEQG
jgi:Transposase.